MLAGLFGFVVCCRIFVKHYYDLYCSNRRQNDGQNGEESQVRIDARRFRDALCRGDWNDIRKGRIFLQKGLRISPPNERLPEMARTTISSNLRARVSQCLCEAVVRWLSSRNIRYNKTEQVKS